MHGVVQVVVCEVQILEGAILHDDVEELVHLVAPHAVPADVQLLEVARAADQLAELSVVDGVHVHIDEAEAADEVARLVELVEKVVCDLGRHLAVLEVKGLERVPQLSPADDGYKSLQRLLAE